MTHAYAAFGELAQLTPTLLPVTVEGPVTEASYTALAGRGANGQIRALVSAQVSSAAAASVSVSGLPANSTWRYSVQSIDAAHASQPGVVMGGVRTVDKKGSLVVNFSLPVPAVALLRVDPVHLAS
jgi:hypothetical protein